MEDLTRAVGRRELRCGYTTGSCAAAAARAAAEYLLRGRCPARVELETPGGALLDLAVLEPERGDGWARCSVRKDAGDDPDVTDGALVTATVSRAPEGLSVDGGAGVGRVTRPGLACAVGEAAINPVPRRMILDALEAARAACGWGGGLAVVVSVPDGERLAAKTYNPRLGVVGGLSILGTTGIVEPMSERALVDSIKLELRTRRAAGERVVALAPGNYGEAWAREHLRIPPGRLAQCSNYVGEALDEAARLGFAGVLLVGHLGKLVKLAGGVFNTHSHTADCRMEILTAHAALAGAGRPLLRAVMDSATTDEAARLLRGAGLLDAVMRGVLERIGWHLRQRAGGEPAVGAVVYAAGTGELGRTDGADALLRELTKPEGLP